MLTLYRVYASEMDGSSVHDERFIFAESEDEAFTKGCGPDLSPFAEYLDFFWTCEEAAEMLERRDHETVNELLVYLAQHVTLAAGGTFKPFKVGPYPHLDDAYPVPDDSELALQYPESFETFLAIQDSTIIPDAAEVVD